MHPSLSLLLTFTPDYQTATLSLIKKPALRSLSFQSSLVKQLNVDINFHRAIVNDYSPWEYLQIGTVILTFDRCNLGSWLWKLMALRPFKFIVLILDSLLFLLFV